MVAAVLPGRARLNLAGCPEAYELVTMSTSLPIELDRASSEPLYRQIEAFVRRAIDSGRLRPGQRLPSVRAVAGQLGVGRLTVATAYESSRPMAIS